MRLKVQSIRPDDRVVGPDYSLLKKQYYIQVEKNKNIKEFVTIGPETESSEQNEVLNEDTGSIFSSASRIELDLEVEIGENQKQIECQNQTKTVRF